MKRLITYTQNNRTTYRNLAIVFGIAFLISIIFYFWANSDFEITSFMDTCAIPLFPFVCCLLLLLDSSIYLKKHKDDLSKENTEYENIVLNKISAQKIALSSSRGTIILFFMIFLFFLFLDIRFLIIWHNSSENKFFEFSVLLYAHLIYTFIAFILFINVKTDRILKYSSVPQAKKASIEFCGHADLFIILSLFSLATLVIISEAVRFLHLYRYDALKNSMESFKKKAYMTISSNDLQDGVWNPDIFSIDGGAGLSPHLYFDPVEGADHYVIYMVDETGGNDGSWLATEIHENELFTGDNLTIHADDPDYRYTGSYIYPPDKSPILVSVYVFALRGEPLNDISTLFSEYSYNWNIEPNKLYVNHLSLITKDDISFFVAGTRYGNVISYGYITGTYYPK